MALVDNPARQRFELDVEGHVAFVNYRRSQGVVALTYAFVPPALRGKGVGSELVKRVLGVIEQTGDKVDPRCPFIAAYMQNHPEVGHLLVDQ